MLQRVGLWLAVAMAGCAAAEENNGGGVFTSTGRFIKLYDVEKSLVDVLKVRDNRLTFDVNLLTHVEACSWSLSCCSSTSLSHLTSSYVMIASGEIYGHTMERHWLRLTYSDARTQQTFVCTRKTLVHICNTLSGRRSCAGSTRGCGVVVCVRCAIM